METERQMYLEESPWVKMDLDWSMLTKGRTPKKFRKGFIFYSEDEIVEHVFIINKGRVELRVSSNNGAIKSALIMDEGCIFGDLTLLDKRPNSCSALVVSDTAEVYYISKTYVIQEMQSNNLIGENLLREGNRIIRLLIAQIRIQSFGNGVDLVCYYLLHMANQYTSTSQHDSGDKRSFNLRFTHQDISGMTGLSRVSVSNIMSKMVKDGVLTKRNGFYEIISLEALQNYSQKK